MYIHLEGKANRSTRGDDGARAGARDASARKKHSPRMEKIGHAGPGKDGVLGPRGSRDSKHAFTSQDPLSSSANPKVGSTRGPDLAVCGSASPRHRAVTGPRCLAVVAR